VSPAESFTVVEGDPRSPVILHVPHPATAIPGWVRDRIVLDDAALDVELGHMTDAGTDTLAYAAASDAARRPWLLLNRLSRLVVDPERFPDQREEMRQVGMGAVYTRTSHGQALRRVDPAHEQDLLETYYHPYAQAMTALVDQRLAATDRAVIIDVHSYPARRLPYELHPTRRRPTVFLGVDEQHTPGWLLAAATIAFAQVGDVVINEPFAGTYVPLHHHDAGDTRVASVMIELRRRTSAESMPRTDPLPPGAAQALASLVDAATDRPW
jgi:N-formylglutamate amidohydrolase